MLKDQIRNAALLLTLLASAWSTGTEAQVSAREPASCPFAVPRGERATCFLLTVPERRTLVGGRTVRIFVAVLHARSGSAVPDPVVVLVGGPGDYAFPDDGAEGWWDVTEPMRTVRDVVIFDPRGVGLSEPNLNCPELEAVALGNWRPDLRPAERVALERPAAVECRARLEAEGIDIGAFTTRQAISDVADLLNGIGVREANLLAFSYGTRVALGVAARYPERVRSMVLDGVYPPDIVDATSKPRRVWNTLQRLASDCANQPECAERFPSLGERLRGVLQVADVLPLEVPARGNTVVRLDGVAMGDALTGLLSTPSLLSSVPLIVESIESGDAAPLTAWLGGGFTGSPIVSEGLRLTVECSETIPFADRRQAYEEIERYGPFGSDDLWSIEWDACEAWNAPVIADDYRRPVLTDRPTMILSGAYDFTTPRDYALHALETLSTAQLIDFRAGAHTQIFTDPCAALMTAAFFETPGAPMDGLCPERLQPPAFRVR